jgi:hypothetical protein
MNYCVCDEVLGEPNPTTWTQPLLLKPKLFIKGVPERTNAHVIVKTLRRAGRDPSISDPSLTPSFRVLAEANWPRGVQQAFSGGGISNVTWKELEDAASGWRRITLRVTPQVYAIAEAEAGRRGVSITQFCIDAIEAQSPARTRSKRIEYELFRCFQAGGNSERHRHFMLPVLVQEIYKVVPGCRESEIVDALKRLQKRNYFKLDKWEEATGFRAYDGRNDVRFFYWGPFRAELTPDGRPYFDALDSQFSVLAQPVADDGKGHANGST